MPQGFEVSVPSPQEDVARADALRSVLDSLSEDHRAVVVAIHYLGCSQKEAAEQLGIPLGTVKSRLSYALAHMRRSLRAHGITGFSSS